jgi:SAM-dependent methyltransferase
MGQGGLMRAASWFWDWTRSWAAGSATVSRWRERRYRLFMELCGVRPDERILDVGAGAGLALARFNRLNTIVALDLDPKPTEWHAQPNVTVRQGDGTQLPFADREFGVAFSNSVIEHVPKHLQPAFAREISRVAERYFVQTPNRFFPIEPHYQVPFIQFLPKRARRALNRYFTLGWQVRGHGEDLNLLSSRDLRRLFPDSEIHRERVFGLTKSLMAVRTTR